MYYILLLYCIPSCYQPVFHPVMSPVCHPAISPVFRSVVSPHSVLLSALYFVLLLALFSVLLLALHSDLAPVLYFVLWSALCSVLIPVLYSVWSPVLYSVLLPGPLSCHQSCFRYWYLFILYLSLMNSVTLKFHRLYHEYFTGAGTVVMPRILIVVTASVKGESIPNYFVPVAGLYFWYILHRLIVQCTSLWSLQPRESQWNEALFIDCFV
jgi:hypothetical protein